MAIDTLANLKGFFDAGDRPTAVQFATSFESLAIPGLSLYTAVNLTADTTLDQAVHSINMGKYVTVSADAKTLTLPAVVPGATLLIVNAGADGTQLLTLSPNGSDKFTCNTEGVAGTDNKDISNTKATQKQYDFCKILGTPEGWAMLDFRGIWATEA